MVEPVYQPFPPEAPSRTHRGPPWAPSEIISVAMAPVLTIGQWALFATAMGALDSPTPQRAAAAQGFALSLFLGIAAGVLAWYGPRSRIRWKVTIPLTAPGFLFGLYYAPNLGGSFGGFGGVGLLVVTGEVFLGIYVGMLVLIAIVLALLRRRRAAWSLEAGAIFAHVIVYLIVAFWALLTVDALAEDAVRAHGESPAWGALAAFAALFVAGFFLRRSRP